MSDIKLNYQWNNMHLAEEPVMAIAAMQSKALNLRTFAKRADYNTVTMRAELEDMSKILGKIIQDVKALSRPQVDVDSLREEEAEIARENVRIDALDDVKKLLEGE